MFDCMICIDSKRSAERWSEKKIQGKVRCRKHPGHVVKEDWLGGVDIVIRHRRFKVGTLLVEAKGRGIKLVILTPGGKWYHILVPHWGFELCLTFAQRETMNFCDLNKNYVLSSVKREYNERFTEWRTRKFGPFGLRRHIGWMKDSSDSEKSETTTEANRDCFG